MQKSQSRVKGKIVLGASNILVEDNNADELSAFR
jgi:hypothetical protein